MDQQIKDFTHQELNQEVRAIGGRYHLVKENRVPFDGRDVLYMIGYAAFDTTCCGSGACNYALVPGFVLNWKNKNNKEGLAVSEVEPIRDQHDQEKIRSLILKQEVVNQVNFL